MKIMHLKTGTGTGTWVDGSLAISQQSNTLHILFQFQRLSSKYNNNDICNRTPCRSFKSKQSLEYIESELRDFNKDFQARADLAVAAVVIGGTGSSPAVNNVTPLLQLSSLEEQVAQQSSS